MTPDFMPPPASAPMDPQALPPGLQTIPQVDGQGAQDAAAIQNALKVEGATGEGTGTGFFDKLRTDPKLSQAMLVMGSALMQGPKPGQDQFGLFGNAMMAGALTHNMLTLNEGVDQRATQESNARVAESAQRTKASEQKMRQDAELHPQLLEKFKAEIQAAKTRNDLDEVRRLTELWKSDPKRLQEEFDSKLANDRASRAANYASAGAANERALTAKDERKWREVLASGTATQEEKDAANLALHGTRSPAAQAKDNIEMLFQQLKKASPPGTPEDQIRQRAIDLNYTKKGDVLLHLQALADNSDLSKEERKKYLDMYQATVKQLVGMDAKPAAGGNAAASQEAWAKARNSVQPGQDYKGPDGITYTRPK